MTLPELLPWGSEAEAAALLHLDQLTKPPGSLGRIERLGSWWCGATNTFPARRPERARLYTFAGDHGVTAEGVSPTRAPSPGRWCTTSSRAARR